jgi:hypothetical protein
VFKGSPAHVSALSSPATRAGIRPIIPGGRRRSRPCHPRFPVVFRPPASASWASCSRRGIPLPSRSAYQAASTWTPTGFPRSAHPSHNRIGCPLYPEAQRCSHVRSDPSGRRSPPLPGARPYHPGPHPSPELSITRRHQGFTRVQPPGLPLAWSIPWMEQGPLGSLPGLRTPTGKTCGARQGGGWASSTRPELHDRHRRTSYP